MPTHELNLRDNALDSLREALAKFEEGDGGDLKAYKFAVQHMSHFVELIFKHHLASIHPLLIYKDPFSRKLNADKTIGCGMPLTLLGMSPRTTYQQSSVPIWNG